MIKIPVRAECPALLWELKNTLTKSIKFQILSSVVRVEGSRDLHDRKLEDQNTVV